MHDLHLQYGPKVWVVNAVTDILPNIFKDIHTGLELFESE